MREVSNVGATAVYEDSRGISYLEIAKFQAFRQNFCKHSGRKITTLDWLTAE